MLLLISIFTLLTTIKYLFIFIYKDVNKLSNSILFFNLKITFLQLHPTNRDVFSVHYPQIPSKKSTFPPYIGSSQILSNIQGSFFSRISTIYKSIRLKNLSILSN